MVRDRIGPVAAFKQGLIVPRLPKTRLGKILRGTVRRVAEARNGLCRRRSKIQSC
ncbi:MAG: hypothetical protein Ct9H300mP13_2120 [Gammaproteobacteria bacterium]|nr:MAG: hypothetical protein Ct9H300mP13_2120 [Gammaproteobacteria bacterium]